MIIERTPKHALCNFLLFRVSNLYEHRTKVVFDLKLIVGWGWQRVALDQRGFRAYRVRVCVD